MINLFCKMFEGKRKIANCGYLFFAWAALSVVLDVFLVPELVFAIGAANRKNSLTPTEHLDF